jgi:hypothetical protein
MLVLFVVLVGLVIVYSVLMFAEGSVVLLVKVVLVVVVVLADSQNQSYLMAN